MSNATARFALPFILPGQAQKELYHNEALARIDGALHPGVEATNLTTPPPEPEEGQCWIVASNASGAWNGRQDQLAIWSEGGWRFVTPTPGMTAWHIPGQHWIYWTGSAWSDGTLPSRGLVVDGLPVVGPRQPAIATPSGGTTIDAEARAALAHIIAALMSHGLID